MIPNRCTEIVVAALVNLGIENLRQDPTVLKEIVGGRRVLGRVPQRTLSRQPRDAVDRVNEVEVAYRLGTIPRILPRAPSSTIAVGCLVPHRRQRLAWPSWLGGRIRAKYSAVRRAGHHLLGLATALTDRSPERDRGARTFRVRFTSAPQPEARTRSIGSGDR